MDIYHALNRGVDKRTIFMDSGDHFRFIHDMYTFNTTKPAKNVYRGEMCDLRSHTSNEQTGIDFIEDRDQQLVDIHGWCLMGNHYHLLLSEQIEGGLVKFLRKLNVGYANYFNKRYKRTGTLFQGRTKKILIDNDAYLLHILNYIHLNPLDFMDSTHNWRTYEIANSNDALEFLKKYRWSSYLDYSGIKNFPSILETEFFQDVFKDGYGEQLTKYIKDIDVHEVRHLLFE